MASGSKLEDLEGRNMSHNSLDQKDERRIISRRAVVMGGLSTAAAAAATFMASRSGTTAVTPMDVKGPSMHRAPAPTKVQPTAEPTK
jgi:hypothetical protein